MAKDRISGILLLIFCAFFYYQSTLIEVKDLTGLQATFFPRLLLGLIAILAIILSIQSFLKKGSKKPKEEQQKQKGWVVWVIFAIFGVYISIIQIIGFIMSSFLFMAVVYVIILPDKKPIKSHLITISGLLVISIALSVIFERFLNVLLPKGIFF
jgi:putative tricarboxylic transport membrane protein